MSASIPKATVFGWMEHCIWLDGTQILAIEAVFAKVTITLSPLYMALPFWSSHMRGPNSLKDFWDRSDPWLVKTIL